MKVPVSWLQRYVEVPPVDALLSRLTEVGHMVDGPLEATDKGPVVSLEIRQNRPDGLSILGIAWEVAAAFGSTVREVHTAQLPNQMRHAEPMVGEDPVYFLRITGVRLDGLAASMLGDLGRYGQRSLSPLVDLANYVMIELGQPLHVYAAEHIDVASAGSRSARSGESLRLIDGRTVELSEYDLIIADQHGPLAVAGAMGASASAVDTDQRDIVVEAGHFRSHLVRRTARRHGLATEASLRSTKLLPPMLPEIALSRFLALLREHGDVGECEVWRSGPARASHPEAISLDNNDLQRIGGVKVRPEESAEIFRSLGFTNVVLDTNETLTATPPWWRTDVEHPADLIEEILRIHGYSRIPPSVLPTLARPAPISTTWDQEESVRGLLCAWGYDEVILDSFVMDEVDRLEAGRNTVRVENPPAGKGVLRPSLLPNMLSGARYLPFLVPERWLFEIGRTFHCVDDRPEERRTVAWTVMNSSAPRIWHAKERRANFYSVKAEAEAVLRTLGVHAVAEPEGSAGFPFLPSRSTRLIDENGRTVGHVGELDHDAYGLKPVRASYGAELFLPSPLDQVRVPGTARRDVESFDISVLVSMATRSSALAQAISDALGDDLIAVYLVDIYAERSDGSQRRSLTFRVVYASSRGKSKAIWEEIGRHLERTLDVAIRGSIDGQTRDGDTKGTI